MCLCLVISLTPGRLLLMLPGAQGLMAPSLWGLPPQGKAGPDLLTFGGPGIPAPRLRPVSLQGLANSLGQSWGTGCRRHSSRDPRTPPLSAFSGISPIISFLSLTGPFFLSYLRKGRRGTHSKLVPLLEGTEIHEVKEGQGLGCLLPLGREWRQETSTN